MKAAGYIMASGLVGLGLVAWARQKQIFAVDGVRYLAIPDKKAAKKARKLRTLFKQFDDMRGGAEASDEGRALIKEQIYEPLDPDRADDLTRRLGTSNESYWSSWFFGKVYEHNPLYRGLWREGTVLLGYPHYKIVDNTADTRNRRLDLKEQTLYLMFPFTEAPLTEGDNIISINRTNPDSFEEYMKRRSQGSSHGRVVARVKRKKATVIGGNERQSVRESDLKLDSSGKAIELDDYERLRMPTGSSRYTALMKQVKVLGKDSAFKRIPWNALLSATCISGGAALALRTWWKN